MANPERKTHYLETPPHGLPTARRELGIKPEHQGNETVLLVDDNPALRELLSIVIASAGYRVLTATDGEDALNLAEKHAAPIHIVLTDVVMPVLDGPTLVTTLRGWYPRMRVIFMTGHAERPEAASAHDDELTRVLHKPVPVPELLATVRELLDTGPPGSLVRHAG